MIINASDLTTELHNTEYKLNTPQRLKDKLIIVIRDFKMPLTKEPNEQRQ